MATELSSSDEEVRRKPEATMPHEPLNEPITASETGHFDILVIGRTGVGKSSTVDKLMVPNTQEVSQAQNSTMFADKQLIDFNPRASSSDKLKISGAQVRKSKKAKKLEGDKHRANIQSGNLNAWVLSDKEDELEKTVTRLKNIVYCRSLDESHTEIDILREDDEAKETYYASSRSCQLLINEDSNIRVLDTPGFFSPELYEGASTHDASNLAIVRRIVYIQTGAGLRFNRILYFLPCGPLRRDEGTILKEVRCIVKFFDKSIFSSMILVGTISPSVSKQPHSKLKEDEKFPDKDLRVSEECFYKVVIKACKEMNEDITDLPKPPMIFVAMTDTCEEILHKVMSTPVTVESGLQLRFRGKICARCGIVIGSREGEKLVCTYSGTNKQTTVPYEESTCHPKIETTITVKSFFRGLAGLFHLKWHFTEERCINPHCKQGPGSVGCKKVRSTYEADDCKGSIIVDHTDTLDDCTIEAPATEGHTTVQ